MNNITERGQDQVLCVSGYYQETETFQSVDRMYWKGFKGTREKLRERTGVSSKEIGF